MRSFFTLCSHMLRFEASGNFSMNQCRRQSLSCLMRPFRVSITQWLDMKTVLSMVLKHSDVSSTSEVFVVLYFSTESIVFLTSPKYLMKPA